MALRALHFFVHASQGIFCFVVIELGNRLDGPPGCRGVAVLARDRKRTVRTARRSALRLRETRAACWPGDRKSTRLNSSHGYISYAVFCLKKKKISNA